MVHPGPRAGPPGLPAGRQAPHCPQGLCPPSSPGPRGEVNGWAGRGGLLVDGPADVAATCSLCRAGRADPGWGWPQGVGVAPACCRDQPLASGRTRFRGRAGLAHGTAAPTQAQVPLGPGGGRGRELLALPAGGLSWWCPGCRPGHGPRGARPAPCPRVLPCGTAALGPALPRPRSCLLKALASPAGWFVCGAAAPPCPPARPRACWLQEVSWALSQRLLKTS